MSAGFYTVAEVKAYLVSPERAAKFAKLPSNIKLLELARGRRDARLQGCGQACSAKLC